MHIGLAGLERFQSFVTVTGDGDNSLSMRWVKFGSRGAMNHAAGAGGGWHPTATTRGNDHLWLMDWSARKGAGTP
ncbi:hypothetical protein ACVI9W_000058 [Pseudomonas sp. 210_17 TE3656]